MNLLLAPHNDDEALFASYTIIREKPLVAVVTDCFAQIDRTPRVTWMDRRAETVAACQILGVPCIFLAVSDTTSYLQSAIEFALSRLQNFDTVYAPMLQGGHPHHDAVHKAVKAVFNNVRCYGTYSRHEPVYASEGRPVLPNSPEEMELKLRALACYKSQHVWSAHHFAAAQVHPEYLSD